MIPLQMLRDSVSSYRELRLADFEIWDTLETLHNVVHLSHTCFQIQYPDLRGQAVSSQRRGDLRYLLPTLSPCRNSQHSLPCTV